jgi:3-isopropylmalate/(R)-2-methylmalate dehydratase small subunit
MQKLTVLTALAAPLPIDNCDTDQIMPKQFLRGIDKAGLDKGVFYNLRFNPDGTRKADCVFNRPGFEKASILVAGPNFGCGSSREHAVWGLMQFGVRAVIAAGFGEIFYSNCFNNGLLAAKVTPEAGAEIFDYLGGDGPKELTLNVADGTISAPGQQWGFSIAERHRRMLLEGLDMLESTLQELPEIERFRHEHERRFPWMAGLAGKRARELRK